MSWEEKSIDSITELVTKGTTPSTYGYKFIKEGVNYIRAEGISKDGTVDESTFLKISLDCHNKLKRSQLKSDDILFSIAGMALGKTGIVKKSYLPANTNQAVAIIRPIKELIFPKFLHYQFINPNFYELVNKFSAQAAQPNINLTQLKSLSIQTPPLPAQKRIADILSAYDDLIENNLKRIKLLEQATQNIYKEWFVHLRFPGHEKTPIDEETGLPEGWKNAELDSVSTVQSSKRVFLADYVDNGVPFYRGKEISQKVKHEDVSKPYFISHEKFREFDSRFGSPKENDILITAVGTIGNCYLVRNSDLPFYFKDGNLLWIHSYNESVSGFYLIQYFQSPIFKGVLNSITIGSSQKALTITAVKKLNITIPNNEILEKFDSIIKPTIKQIEVLAKTMTQLKAARDILLPRLMNRTIEVE